MFRKNRFLAAVAIALVTALPASGDDKDFLRPVGDRVPPNLLIVFGNSQTMTQTTSFTGTDTSTWDGDADSPASKLGSGKRVVKKFVADNYTRYNIGLTTFAHDPNAGSIDIDRKHWVYVAVGTVERGLGSLDYPGDSFAEPIGTLERWGPKGEGPCTNKIDPSCADRSPVMQIGASGSVTGPFYDLNPGNGTSCGVNGAACINLTPTTRILMKITAGKYGDGYTDGSLSALTLGTHSIVVTKQYQTKVSGTQWDPADTPAPNPGLVQVLYRPLGAPLPPDDEVPNADLFYPAGATDSTNGSLAGSAIGFLNDPQEDFDVNGNCSGWEFQTNSDQVPLIKIPRDYYWGAACSPPQNSLPCMNRLLRPQAYIENYKNGLFKTHDPDNPGYTGPGDKYADGCDPTLLGAVQAGLDVPENNAILTNRQGSQIPLKNLVVNILAYFKTPRHDGFQNGARLDDPNAACRNSAVILIYDSSNGCQNDTCGFLRNQALDELRLIGIPVYVIGYGANLGENNACAGDPDALTDTCPLVCIPQHSGALKLDRTPGYFPVTSDAELYLALSTIASLINESQKGFASSTVAVAQASGDQVAFLATFNASNNKSIWTGRVNAYKLDPSGNLTLSTRRITDPLDPFAGSTVPTPSNDPNSLMWNAGENLAQTPVKAGRQFLVLVPGDPLTNGTYQDISTVVTTTIKTSRYPGRKIVFSLPQNLPNPLTALPIPADDAVPEARYDMVTPSDPPVPGTPLPWFNSPPAWWTAMRTLLTPQAASVPPFVLNPPIGDDDATDSLSFIWGDRDAVILAAEPAAPADKLYGGLKLGDVFHSSPQLVGPPSDVPLFVSNLNGYQAFRETYKHRRRLLLVGANDGLLHVFDAGAWDRPATRDQCDLLPDGTRDHCFDLGTGAELFAYAPRSIMQIFKGLKDARGPQTRRIQWTVDGPPSAADVHIDSNHNGTPDPAHRTWHTVVVGGMREGSPFEGTAGAEPADSLGSYYALDITQPDPLLVDSDGKVVPVPSQAAYAATYDAPLCLDADGHGSCGIDAADPAVRAAQTPRAWPTILWEISDVGDEDTGLSPGVGFIDMGETWSKPSLGRVKICTSDCGTQTAATEDRYVAIFGGGFDRERFLDDGTRVGNRRGNWIYMVDIETGHVIYRANSTCGVNDGGGGCSPTYFGSIPGELAAHDANGDGTLDVIYFGDLMGRLYRIDLSDMRFSSTPPTPPTRWKNKIDVTGGSGKPFLFFETPQLPPGTHPFYPIYHRPTIISLGFSVDGKPAVGVAFGTGDRDDITSNVEPQALAFRQRFYYVVDRNNQSTLTETAAGMLNITSPTAASVTTAQENGWFIQLLPGERNITDSLAVGGVIFFTGFNPLAAGNTSNPCAANSPECGLAAGTARLYRVFYATGNPYLPGTDRGQAQLYGGFLSDPVYFEAADQSGNVIFTTENTVTKEKSPGAKKTAIKSWKERSRRP